MGTCGGQKTSCKELLFFFHYVGPGDQSQVVRPDSKGLYLLSDLVSYCFGSYVGVGLELRDLCTHLCLLRTGIKGMDHHIILAYLWFF